MAYLLLGPILWSAHFAVIYGAQSSLCRVAGPERGSTAVVTTVAVATLLVLVLLTAVLLRPPAVSRFLRAAPWPEATQRFCDRIMVLQSMLSLFGVIWAGATLILLPACPPLR